jgi:hypothetical protein
MSGVFQNIDPPPPSPPGESVPPAFVAGGEHTRWAEREVAGGGQYFGRRQTQLCARIYRPSFRENKLNTLVFSHAKRAYWACFPENWVYKFGHCTLHV